MYSVFTFNFSSQVFNLVGKYYLTIMLILCFICVVIPEILCSSEGNVLKKLQSSFYSRYIQSTAGHTETHAEFLIAVFLGTKILKQQ